MDPRNETTASELPPPDVNASGDQAIDVGELEEDFSIDAIEEAYQQALAASELISDDQEFAKDATAEPSEEFEPSTEDEGEDTEEVAEEYNQDAADDVPSVTEKDVVEALLFVGSDSLTSKKIAGVLHGNTSAVAIEELIAELNSDYERQQRPYRVELHEGGYQMSLMPEFERIRERVYGLAPREIRLSQEVVEVLSIIAYCQPISREDVDKISDKNAGSMVNQLLRRELIAIHSKGKARKDVTYVTTDRFLQLFGLGELGELPQADELDMK